MPDGQLVNLRSERLLVERQWNGSEDEFVPLSLAAALALYESLTNAEDDVRAGDYDEALNLAAIAMSCVAAVYTMDHRQRWAKVQIDLRTDRFAFRASEVRTMNGGTVAPVYMKRAEVLSALPIIRDAELGGILQPRSAVPLHGPRPT